MIKEAATSLHSFLLGAGVAIYLLFEHFEIFLNIEANWWLKIGIYCSIYYAVINIAALLFYKKEHRMISLLGILIGTTFGLGLIMSYVSNLSYKPFGFYLIILSFFHFSEYFTTALTNPANLSLDSYLLNHGSQYWIAAGCCWIEFFVERYFFNVWKELWFLSVTGVIFCIIGEVIRKLAMITASKNFNHIVQSCKKEEHELVTHGIYSVCRHPSYAGWFVWSISTQIILINPVCFVLYALAAFSFFKGRVEYEEFTLLKFFGEEYVEYKKKVYSGIPFISGYESDR